MIVVVYIFTSVFNAKYTTLGILKTFLHSVTYTVLDTHTKSDIRHHISSYQVLDTHTNTHRAIH